METMKFKVGDKVRVKSLEWYDENKNEEGLVKDKMTEISGIHFNESMSHFCGSILTIKDVDDEYYFYKMSGSVYYWQDWMLEDEPVSEEKKEVEQLNKNDMKTKEMTKEEVFEFLKDTKILCTSKEESIKIQVALFAFGIEWISRKKGIDEDKYLLFINNRLEIQHTSDIDFWMDNENKRIEPSEIFAIKIKEEKPKFDPKSLRPFDKVLVKNDTIWYARFYDMKRESAYYTTSGEVWINCIPYNEETQYLHGTTEEAPEFYRI